MIARTKRSWPKDPHVYVQEELKGHPEIAVVIKMEREYKKAKRLSLIELAEDIEFYKDARSLEIGSKYSHPGKRARVLARHYHKFTFRG